MRPGTLDDDLRRRDVTVNAIALRLDGTLAAVDGALEDLEAGVLRVLHDASFVDDPTRVWRVARYAARLGFDVDDRTRARWPPRADPGDGERRPPRGRAAPGPRRARPAGRAAGRGRRSTPPTCPRASTRARARCRPRSTCCPTTGAATCSPWPPAPPGWTPARCWRGSTTWASSRGDRDRVAAASRYSTGAPLRAARTNAEIARAARGAPVEAVALAGGRERAPLAGRPARRAASRSTATTCSPPACPQGPEIGARLQRALDRKLDGEIAGREQELATALAQDGG